MNTNLIAEFMAEIPDPKDIKISSQINTNSKESDIQRLREVKHTYKRFDNLDFIRGTAFICMFIHHLFYFGILGSNKISGQKGVIRNTPDLVSSIGLLSRTTFIFLVGFGISESFYRALKKQQYEIANSSDTNDTISENIWINNYYTRINRSFEILVHAFIITLLTILVYRIPGDKLGDNYNIILFGVLHFIGFASIITSTSLYQFGPYWGWFILTIIWFILKSKGLANLLNINSPITNYISSVIGNNKTNYLSQKQHMDYFSLIKWLPTLIFGGLTNIIGNLSCANDDLLGNSWFNTNDSISNSIEYIGKNSLYLYTFHIILFILIEKYRK